MFPFYCVHSRSTPLLTSSVFIFRTMTSWSNLSFELWSLCIYTHQINSSDIKSPCHWLFLVAYYKTYMNKCCFGFFSFLLFWRDWITKGRGKENQTGNSFSFIYFCVHLRFVSTGDENLISAQKVIPPSDFHINTIRWKVKVTKPEMQTDIL